MRLEARVNVSQLEVLPQASIAAPADSAEGAPLKGNNGFAAVLEALGRSIDRGEALANRSLLSFSKLDARELIALQLGIYRYTEAVDLAVKLIDRASNAIRTTLQSSGA